MNSENLSGDGLDARRRRRRRRRLGGGVTLVGRKRRGGKRRGRKVCIRTKSGSKVCGVRWRRRKRR